MDGSAKLKIKLPHHRKLNNATVVIYKTLSGLQTALRLDNDNSINCEVTLGEGWGDQRRLQK